MDIPEIRTELVMIRKDVDDIKSLLPDIRLALQQLAVTNERLVTNMDEHKIMWTKINGLQDKCEDMVLPHITIWSNHHEVHDKLDVVVGKLLTEHAVCMAEKIPKPETTWDKIRPNLITILIIIVSVLILRHADTVLPVLGK